MPTTSNKPTTSRAAPAPTNADLEAARATLRQSLQALLGPGTRELALQVEALREVLPDAQQRQRAALRLLALKGVPASALVAELQQTLAGLTGQSEAFASKLSARRAAVDEQRRQAVEACRVQTAETEQAVARLEAELETARGQLVEAAARRQQALATCNDNATRLAAKQQSFERALGELHAEYATLKQQISNAESLSCPKA
jgi:chromosome segregation ATPase